MQSMNDVWTHTNVEVKLSDFYGKKSLGIYTQVEGIWGPTEEVKKYWDQKVTHLSREGQACG